MGDLDSPTDSFPTLNTALRAYDRLDASQILVFQHLPHGP